ncbi:interleukin-8-like [Tachysurus vachellii]|nr:interleukin-8-like [Tachysurus vachellii]
MNHSALVITFLTCALLAMTEGVPHMQPRCLCTKTMKREISDNRIVKIEIHQPGPHCINTEVIATVKFQNEMTLCLNPEDEWVQKALKKRNLTL